MPRPAHQLVTFSGVMGAVSAPIEQWSFGLRFPDLRYDSGSQTTVDAMANAFSSLQPIFSNLTTLTKTRVASVGADGKVKQTSGGSFLQKDSIIQKAGTGAATTFIPPQCAVVVSLGTPRQGTSGKGRIYLPQTIHAISSSDYRISAAHAQAIADAAKAFLNALAAIDAAAFSGDEKGAHVVSTKGFMSPVRNVRVGRAIDTLRSRRRDVPEGYVSATL